MKENNLPKVPTKTTRIVNWDVDDEDASDDDKYTPKNILDTSLTRNEVKRIIRADTYWANTPTEDSGVYRRKVSFPLAKKLGFAVIVILLFIALFVLAKSITQN